VSSVYLGKIHRTLDTLVKDAASSELYYIGLNFRPAIGQARQLHLLLKKQKQAKQSKTATLS